VSLLLANGADVTAVTAKGETPAALSNNPEVHKLLGMEPGVTTISTESSPNLPITPYYLKHQPLNGRVDLCTSTSVRRNTEDTQTNCTSVTNTAVKLGHNAGGSTQNDGKF
jgi:hypothetical protein